MACLFSVCFCELDYTLSNLGARKRPIFTNIIHSLCITIRKKEPPIRNGEPNQGHRR